jgi:uncharacterized membrane protein
MTASAHLWAIGFDDAEGAHRARDEIARLGWETGGVKAHLILEDMAVVVRHPDGSFSLDREPFPAATNILGCSAVGFLIGLVLAAPLAGAAIGALVGGVGTAASAAAVGIGEDFVREVEGMMRPGTSALFVLDDVGNLDVILHAIRGLGGTVLRTNVDRERAKLIQSTLAAGPADAAGPTGRNS